MPLGAHAVCREGGSRAEFSGRVGPTVRHGQKGKTASFRNQEAIGRDAFSQPPQPFLMILFRQIPSTSLFYQALVSTIVNFVVKIRGNVAVAPAMRSIFHELASDFALDNFQTMQEAVDQSNFSSRMGLYLTGAFAGMAVLMVMLVRCSRPARQLSPPRIRDYVSRSGPQPVEFWGWCCGRAWSSSVPGLRLEFWPPCSPATW
jgi:hypothetical protein